MKALFLTREYPPHIYGGAGVVVDHLSTALSRRMAVEVRCFGERPPNRDGITVRGYTPWDRVKGGQAGPRYDDPERRRAMGQAGRRRVEEQFSWVSVAERTERVYAEAITDFKRDSGGS